MSSHPNGTPGFGEFPAQLRFPQLEFLCVSTGWTKTLHEVQLQLGSWCMLVLGLQIKDDAPTSCNGMQRYATVPAQARTWQREDCAR